jgi:general secretion pathway protein M
MMRWEDLQYREKIAVVGGGAALVLALLYLLMQPLLSRRARLRDEVATRQAELVWMQNSAAEIIGSGDAAQKPAAASPLKLIDQTVRANDLSGQLKRLEPGTGNEIKVWMEDVVYVDLIHWLRQLAGEGPITIASLTVEKSGAPGRVNARLTFTGNGNNP